jgi:hypothetical protein
VASLRLAVFSTFDDGSGWAGKLIPDSKFQIQNSRVQGSVVTDCQVLVSGCQSPGSGCQGEENELKSYNKML